MTRRTRSRMGWLAPVVALAMITSACGSSDDDDGGGATETEQETSDEATADATEGGDDTDTTDAPPATISTGQADENPGDEESSDEGTAEASSEATADEPAEAAPATGTLRYAEFSGVTTFDPAGTQSAQSAFLYPAYDTLTRQNADFSLSPALATAWVSPEPTVWEFTLRDDVVFHDGAEFNAQVAADNLLRHQSFEGNPNRATWGGMTSATAVDDTTLRVEFSAPQPQFPIQMSMVMGMMVSPNAFDDDLTRSPAGSGPWIWQDGESQAGVTEVYTLNADYWDPSAQGVERVEVTTVADNTARLNAVLTGEVDIAATLRNAEAPTAIEEGLEVLSVPNYFPYLIVTGRDGVPDESLESQLVRQAIAYSVDREAYAEAIQVGIGDSKGGIFPEAFSEWHVPELDDSYGYDPERARELLAEAGYPDGITVKMPVMPAITPPVDLIVQMLGASGINVDLVSINNGELGPRTTNRENREWGISWFRDLLYHPANDLPKFVDVTGRLNPGGIEDSVDLSERLVEAAEAPDLATAQEIYAEVTAEIIDRGIVIPLSHGAQNAAFDPEKVEGVVMGLNMQAPLPYGVTVAE